MNERWTNNGIPVHMEIFAVLLRVETHVSRSLRAVICRSPTFVGPDDAMLDSLD